MSLRWSETELVPCSVTRSLKLGLSGLVAILLVAASGSAQQGQQPPAFTAPQPAMPSATDAPGQRTPPTEQRPDIAPDAPLPQPDQSTVNLRDLKPLSPQPVTPVKPSADVERMANGTSLPRSEALYALNTHFFNVVAPYLSPRAPNLPMNSGSRLAGMVRDGKLYLSISDAIALAIENNLDVKISRYNLLLTDTDITRAQVAARYGDLTSPFSRRRRASER